MLNFPGYDVSESRRLFSGDVQSSASTAGQSSLHRSPGYLHGFTDPCYDPTANHAGYAQSLAGYPVSAPTYGSYRLPFSMSHAAAVYDEQRKFDCYSKPDINCSSSIETHGNYTLRVYMILEIFVRLSQDSSGPVDMDQWGSRPMDTVSTLSHLYTVMAVECFNAERHFVM